MMLSPASPLSTEPVNPAPRASRSAPLAASPPILFPNPRTPTPGPRPLAFSISGGIAEVRPHSVTILADSASAD